MTNVRSRTFFRHTPTFKAAEDAELNAAIKAWQEAGGEIRQVTPVASEEQQEWWEALRGFPNFEQFLQAETAAEADLHDRTFDQWKRKLPW